jgi:mono/diheme cytochrome c family protein
MIVRAQMLLRPAWSAPAALAFAAPFLLVGAIVPALAATAPSDLPGDPTRGKAIYQSNCIACHGVSLQGGVGKRLNPIQKGHDNASFIITTITGGVRGTQMPAWATANGGSLDDQQIRDLASFILASQSASAPPEAGQVAQSTIAWVGAGVSVMLAATFVLARYNMSWIRRRSHPKRTS